MTGEPDEARPLVPLRLPGIAAPHHRVYPVADDVADKLCALLDTHPRATGPAQPSIRSADEIGVGGDMPVGSGGVGDGSSVGIVAGLEHAVRTTAMSVMATTTRLTMKPGSTRYTGRWRQRRRSPSRPAGKGAR